MEEDNLSRPLSAEEKQKRIHEIPLNSNSNDHLSYIWQHLICRQHIATQHVYFAITSYGGYNVTKLIDSKLYRENVGSENQPVVVAIGMADSSHFLDFNGELEGPESGDFLRTAAKNWICSTVDLGEVDPAYEIRLHVPCVSSGTKTFINN